MSDSTSVTWPTDLSSAVRLAQTLHDIEWGWNRPDIERLVDAHPDWKIRREFADCLVAGLEPSRGYGSPFGPELFLDALEPKSKHYVRARLPLLEFHLPTPGDERGRALEQLSRALESIGAPTRVPACADGFGLRWQSGERTMLLQSNERRAWISVQPVVRRAEHIGPELLAVIAALVPLLHDRADGCCDRTDVEQRVAELPGWSVDFADTHAHARVSTADPDCQVSFLGMGGRGHTYDHLGLYRFEQDPGLERRREVFGEVYRAIRGVIGEPTLYGGGPDGPDVRWRNAGKDARVLRLRADSLRVWVETCPADELEEEELTTFEHGGPSGGPDGPSDFPRLPYTWQLVLHGPGDTATYLPGGRLALTMPHLQEALETLLKVWIEQLPVQRPGEKVTFTIASRGISGGMSFTYDTVKGILLRVGSRDGDPAAAAAAMSAVGWQPSGRRWKAEFKNPTERTATEVATLVVTELAARGVTEPYREITAKRVGIGTPTHGAHGFFRATGLGIERA
ncbi:hypothetical protein [Streptomyces sp. NPDC000410]|uniref:hypothetical protein n=1 Tax=Streptomyces sp. NPDC000410 TaxID=3154254 RepID=UPI0033175325